MSDDPFDVKIEITGEDLQKVLLDTDLLRQECKYATDSLKIINDQLDPLLAERERLLGVILDLRAKLITRFNLAAGFKSVLSSIEE
mgnify:CR=1 FL=1